MRKWFVFIAVIILAGAAAFFFSTFDFFSPRYDGRPVVDWMLDGYVRQGQWDGSYYGSPEAQKANAAVLAIGTNAIPYYLHLLKTPDDPRYKTVAVGWLDDHISESLNGWFAAWPHSQENLRACGANGLILLGPSAKSVIPEFTRMLNSSTGDRADELIEVIGSLGPDGIPPLINCLAKPGPLSKLAILALQNYTSKNHGFFTNSDAEIESAARTIVPVVLPLLTNTDKVLRLNAAIMILYTPIQVDVNRSVLATALAFKPGSLPNDETLVNALRRISPNHPNAIAILQQISTDTNSAYADEAAAILARVRSNSLPLIHN